MALFGASRPDHPMADMKQARELVSDLPANDPLKALDEVTFWLDSINRTPGFKLDYRFELLDLLDQAAKVHQRKLSQEYLATERQEKFREHRLWTSIFEFWKVVGASYIQCIDDFEARASGAGSIKKHLPVIIARALRALTLQLKWVMLRYGLIEERVWGSLGRLYLFAEAKCAVTAPLEIYPGVHGEGTVQQEFLKAMMLGVSSTGGLTPVKQNIAERAIAHFAAHFALQRAPGEGCNFCFDLTASKPMARVQKSTAQKPTVRYFGAGPALPALRRLIEDIQTKDGVPADVNLGGAYNTALVLSVLQHLEIYWLDTPPSRRSERRKTAARLTVVHGFKDVLRSMVDSQDANPQHIFPQDGSESWIVENVSDGGFGAIIPQVKGDWIEVGNLLGVRTESSKYWGAGVVRRIEHDEYQQCRVGIYVFSRSVIPVKLSPANLELSEDEAHKGDDALLLSTVPDANGEIALLLKVDHFSTSQALEMRLRGKRYYLLPSKLIEGGDDFEWAKFRVMKRN